MSSPQTTSPQQACEAILIEGKRYNIEHGILPSENAVADRLLARGVELGRSEPFFKRLKNSVSILLPLILTSLNRIDTISNAMELRGFGKHDKRTWYTRRPFARRDFIALAVGVVLLLISLTVTIRFGRFYNPFV